LPDKAHLLSATIGGPCQCPVIPYMLDPVSWQTGQFSRLSDSAFTSKIPLRLARADTCLISLAIYLAPPYRSF
jgi:hypothetical protein